MQKVFIFLFSYLFFCNSLLVAQKEQTISSSQITDSSYIKISSIKIIGNKHTKDYIILREMPFSIGDSLQQNKIPTVFTQAKNQVYNTNLFIEVKIDSVALPDTSLQVNILVKERWYIFPTPQFQLVDRSFNEWYKTFNADFKRVVYGVNFTHYNFSGRRDKLSITLLNGYARNVSFSYSNPYSNPSLTQGFGISGSYTQNREIGFATSYNHQIRAYKKDGFVRDAAGLGVGFSLRKGFFKRTSFSLGMQYYKVDDSVITSKYNTNYFNDDNNKQFYTDISVGTSYANTDKNAYPLKGLKYSYGISKRGFGLSGGINSFTIAGGIIKYITHKHQFYSSIKFAGNIKLPFKQAYINQRAIGYGDLKLRGLELYVIDGVASSVANYTFSKKIVSFKIPVPFKIKALPYIPFNIFAKVYTDAGYSYLPDPYAGKLNNKFIYTSGFGVDVLSIYDIVLKVEYSFNQLGQNGLFLHGGTNF
jgi:outer membrane protein assembly factor BamA